MTEQKVPHSFEAEAGVVGLALFNENARTTALDRVDTEDIYDTNLAIIFDAIQTIYQRGDDVNQVTVKEQLQSQGQFEDIGGMSTIADLVDYSYNEDTIESYCDVVEAKAAQRRLIGASRATIDEAYSVGPDEIENLLDRAEGRIFAVSEQAATGGARKASDILWETFEKIEERQASDSHISGVHTGFDKLDNMTTGLGEGDLILLAGRPSMGKTAFALNVACNAAIQHNVPTAIFSLEMSEGALVERMLSSEAEINNRKLRKGTLEDEEYRQLSSAAGYINESPIYIDDTPAITPLQMRAKARRAKKEHDIGLILLDYLQLMGTDDAPSREQEIAKISRALKGIGKELGVPVVALSQLSRACEQREDKRPRLSDLRYSGALEQNADLVAFIYRDEVYNENATEGETELLVRKQRNGPTGKIYYDFKKQYTKFIER